MWFFSKSGKKLFWLFEAFSFFPCLRDCFSFLCSLLFFLEIPGSWRRETHIIHHLSFTSTRPSVGNSIFPNAIWWSLKHWSIRIYFEEPSSGLSHADRFFHFLVISVGYPLTSTLLTFFSFGRNVYTFLGSSCAYWLSLRLEMVGRQIGKRECG